jgi:hypothetical protein
MPQLQGVQGSSYSMLPRTLGNAEDGVASTFPMGKQNGEFALKNISLTEDIRNFEQTPKNQSF